MPRRGEGKGALGPGPQGLEGIKMVIVCDVAKHCQCSAMHMIVCEHSRRITLVGTACVSMIDGRVSQDPDS